MRFLDLRLHAFGPFTEVSVDLSPDTGKLSIVYGPNEAGKSGALRALQAVLFGIPAQSSDNFLHDYKNLRIGATLENSSGQTLHYLRRKGNKATLLNPEHAQGAALPDSVLDPFLGAMDAATFGRIFAIDYRELERGGDEMQQLRGLVGESLFAAGMGGANLAKVLRELDEDAVELFGRNKRKATIAQAKKDYEDANKEKRDAALPSSRWQDQQRQLQEACQRRDQVVAKITQLRTQHSRLGRIRSSLSLLARRSSLIGEIAAFGEATVLPQEYSPEERARVQTELDETASTIARLEDRLDSEDGLRGQLEAITIAPGFLEQATAIQDLQQWLGATIKANRDRDHLLSVQRDECTAQIQRMLRDLGVHSDSDDAPRIAPDSMVAIQNLGNQQHTLENARADQKSRKQDMLDIAEAKQQRLGELGEARDMTALSRQIELARDEGDLEKQIRQRSQELSGLNATAEQRLAGLGLWTGSLEEVARLPIPLRETIDEFARDLQSIEAQLDKQSNATSEVEEEIANLRTEIETLKKSTGSASETELSDLRDDRDRLWWQIRQSWLSDELDQQAMKELLGDDSDSLEACKRGLAVRFEASLKSGDEMSDLLRHKAADVARLAVVESRKTSQDAKLARLRKGVCDCEDRRAALVKDWENLWSTCEIEPLSPREMLAWMDRHHTLLQLAERRTELQAELDRFVQTSKKLADSIASSLKQLKIQPNDCQLAALIETARSAVVREQQAQQRRETLRQEIDELKQQTQRLARSEANAAEQLADWRRQWKDAMRQLGCPEDASSAQANERMSQLNKIADLIDKREDLTLRIKAIDKDDGRFQEEVKSLVSQIAPDLSTLPATQAAGELRSRLTRAQRDHVLRRQLNDEMDEVTVQLEQTRERHSELTAKLSRLCQLAGTTEHTELTEVERSSRELVQRRESLDQVEQQLREIGAGLSLDQIAAEAEGHDVDQLTAQLSEIDVQLASLEAQRDESVARVRELENLCRIEDTSSVAAEADERALGILTRMQADAERYLKLRMAAAILRHEIDRHRAANQDPLLARASDLFSRITCGEFSELRSEYDESDQAAIVGIRRRSKEIISVDAMSGGTRDQLYLSLRLSYLESRLTSEPMPLIVDDILIEFDNDRALATLEVLAELAERTQVVFFTHHHHLVDLVHAKLSDRANIHYLDSRQTDLAAAGLRATSPR